jgi:hypothetical protein
VKPFPSQLAEVAQVELAVQSAARILDLMAGQLVCELKVDQILFSDLSKP